MIVSYLFMCYGSVNGKLRKAHTHTHILTQSEKVLYGVNHEHTSKYTENSVGVKEPIQFTCEPKCVCCALNISFTHIINTLALYMRYMYSIDSCEWLGYKYHNSLEMPIVLSMACLWSAPARDCMHYVSKLSTMLKTSCSYGQRIVDGKCNYSFVGMCLALTTLNNR